MRSVADDIRTEAARSLAQMTPEARVALAFALGERAIEIYMAANRVSRKETLAAFRRATRAGRQYSRVTDEP